MPAPVPRMHGITHGHGGPDPALLEWESIGGDTVIVGDNSPPDAFFGSGSDTVYANPVTVTGGDVTVTALHAMCRGTGSVRLSVWASNGPGAGPGTLICQTATIAGPVVTAATDVSGPPLAAATLLDGVTYWVGYHQAGASMALAKISAGTLTLTYAFLAFGTGAPDPFPAASTAPNAQGSMWIVGTT